MEPPPNFNQLCKVKDQELPFTSQYFLELQQVIHRLLDGPLLCNYFDVDQREGYNDHLCIIDMPSICMPTHICPPMSHYHQCEYT